MQQFWLPNKQQQLHRDTPNELSLLLRIVPASRMCVRDELGPRCYYFDICKEAKSQLCELYRGSLLASQQIKNAINTKTLSSGGKHKNKTEF